MSHSHLHVAAIQPSCPRHTHENEAMRALAWKSATAAADRGARLIVLPEYFNVMGLPEEEVRRESDQTPLLRRTAATFCRQHRCWLLLPLIESRGSHRFNASHLVNPDGDTVFTYDKTHLTLVERDRYDRRIQFRSATPGKKHEASRVGR